jgi:hypothetical protein
MIGRRVRALGPLVVRIDAPRDLVFAQIAVPYRAAHPPRELAAKVQVLERHDDTVVAAHRTRVGPLTVVTVESVVLVEPDEVRFQLLRGPVPYVRERFVLREVDGGATELAYDGELGTDLWALGAWWGALVARRWVRTVDASLAALRSSTEAAARRTAARRAGSDAAEGARP